MEGAGFLREEHAIGGERQIAQVFQTGNLGDEALEVAATIVGSATREKVNRMREAVSGGASFADALAEHPSMFGELYVNMVRAGEATGNVDVVLSRLADYLQLAGAGEVAGAKAKSAIFISLGGGPSHMDTYDLKPEMSAQGITDTVVKAIEKGEFDAIIMNYANADMVGHSGNLEATIKAVEAVDAGLAQIYQTLKARGGVWLITADHGNAEMLIDPATGGPHTAHTTNPVPFLYITEEGNKPTLREGGSLRDISPTILSLLNLDQPNQMTGGNLRTS